MAKSTKKPDISVVVPVKNEEDNVIPLIEEIYKALNDYKSFEIVYVDDGSDDKTPEVLLNAQKKFPMLKIIRHEKSCGQSQAVATGVKYAEADVIVTLDGDGQNDPADIPALIKKSEEQAEPSNVLIAGHRHKRKDSFNKRISSKLANKVRRALLKDNTPDTGCGIKLFYREAFLDMPRFNHMHRYLPALMIRRGGEVISVHVNHRHRERGLSKYGFWNRFWVGIVDLLGVMWLIRRASVPSVSFPREK